MTDNTGTASGNQPADQGGGAGRIALGGHGDVSKNDVRAVAVEECDAANAAIAVAMAGGGLPADILSMLLSTQNDLFDLNADLSVPTSGPGGPPARILPGHTERLDRAIGHYREQANAPEGLVLPGGTIAAALLYQARAAVRRAERAAWAAVERHPDAVNPETARYLNRLSTLLFTLARGANAEHGDVVWVPGSSVRALPDDQ
ncbi:ATP:cob(I)alamin adenosyltransferase [Arthrobacter halodurans]|uniref:Corrinoid adenosyltransferase n=1 Tax=Arthrobacter halodurans TaxID=516699 RepID=A0ABV4UI56_9MICC